MEHPNLNYIKQLSGDNKTFENKFIAILKDEFPGEKKEYLEAITENRYKDAAMLVHKLKHKFSILGLEEGYGIAVEYEKGLLEGDRGLSATFEAVLEIIESYLKTI